MRRRKNDDDVNSIRERSKKSQRKAPNEMPVVRKNFGTKNIAMVEKIGKVICNKRKVQ
jgi:hypothetical protein